jgi:hypothetical protein
MTDSGRKPRNVEKPSEKTYRSIAKEVIGHILAPKHEVDRVVRILKQNFNPFFTRRKP